MNFAHHSRSCNTGLSCESSADSLLYRNKLSGLDNMTYNCQSSHFNPTAETSPTAIIGKIKEIYEQVIHALNSAANLHVPVASCNFFTFWWDAELNQLKSNSCTTHAECGVKI